MSLGENILELRHISKTFPGVVALKNIDMSVKNGEVHALLGENGAGKSTLIKILSGYHQPDSGGELLIDGKPVTFKNPKEAIEASIITIYQELTLCPHMTVAENIVLDKQDQFKGILLRKQEFRDIAARALKDLNQSDIDPDWIVKDLSIAQQQVVEIAKAVTSKAKVVLMDEPTSSISQKDADKADGHHSWTAGQRRGRGLHFPPIARDRLHSRSDYRPAGWRPGGNGKLHRCDRQRADHHDGRA